MGLVEYGNATASKYFFFLNFSWGHILLNVYLICSIMSLSAGVFDYICIALLAIGIFYNGFIMCNYNAEEIENVRVKIQNQS